MTYKRINISNSYDLYMSLTNDRPLLAFNKNHNPITLFYILKSEPFYRGTCTLTIMQKGDSRARKDFIKPEEFKFLVFLQ